MKTKSCSPGGIVAPPAMAVAAVAMLAVVAIGCQDGEADDGDDHRPLQPLIYTEDPELTPEGAAVREQRLQRQLLEGAADGDWGRLEVADREGMPDSSGPRALGEAVTDALLQRDEQLWEHVFVTDDHYAELTGVDPERAADFVDNAIGESMDLWELFDHSRDPDVPERGLDARIEFRNLELGTPRNIDGAAIDDPDEAVEFTDNRLRLADRETDVSFELPIPRIFQTVSANEIGEADSETQLHVGAGIEVGDRLRVYLKSGLHLEPQLLRPEEYPFPLGIGTFWRYERVRADADVDAGSDGQLDRRLEDDVEVGAEELIIEVREISRYGSHHLVEFLHSYRDRHHTRINEWWVTTPRRIYRCDERCRDNIEDIEWLLDYFADRSPVLEFPLRLGASIPSDSPEAPVIVDDQWHDVDTAAGTFTGSYRLEEPDVRRPDHRYLRDVDLVRYFAPGRGMVQRRIEPGEAAEDQGPVVEQLVEYRIMD